jgi:hypothetical protein
MKLGRKHRTPETRCMRCDTPLNAASKVADDAAADSRPARGDISVCIQCGHVAIFTRNGKLREPTRHEWPELLADPRVKNGRDAVSLLHLRGKPN